MIILLLNRVAKIKGLVPFIVWSDGWGGEDWTLPRRPFFCLSLFEINHMMIIIIIMVKQGICSCCSLMELLVYFVERRLVPNIVKIDTGCRLVSGMAVLLNICGKDIGCFFLLFLRRLSCILEG